MAVTLNEQKAESHILRHVIYAEGIHADPEKIKAIQEFPVPRKGSQKIFWDGY